METPINVRSAREKAGSSSAQLQTVSRLGESDLSNATLRVFEGAQRCHAGSQTTGLGRPHLIQVRDELGAEGPTLRDRRVRLPFAADRRHDAGHRRGDVLVQMVATVLSTGYASSACRLQVMSGTAQACLAVQRQRASPDPRDGTTTDTQRQATSSIHESTDGIRHADPAHAKCW